MQNKTKIVVVDDSATMRKLLSITLNAAADFEVVATAKDGEEAYQVIKKVKPDLVTLDVQMPNVDGIEALRKIMKECPVPVIMLSALTTEGADATLKALELGAIDFIPKDPSLWGDINNFKEDLVKKIREILKQRSYRKRLISVKQHSNYGNSGPKSVEKNPISDLSYKAIGIGISTGGPMALQKALPKLSGHIDCPIFIVQHMPPKFTKSLADRLNGMCRLEVKEAENNEIVKNGVIYIAPGGKHMTVTGAPGQCKIVVGDEPSNTLHRPSVNVMMLSLIEMFGKHLLGVIMTGMGKDGFEGIKELKKLGGYCITQDEESCVVYGMPRAVSEAGLSDIEAPIDKIPELINQMVKHEQYI